MAELTEFKGLDKFADKVKLLEKKAPGLIIDRYDKLGRRVIKDLKAATPASNIAKKTSERLKGKWTAEPTVKEQGVYIKKIRNKSPIFGVVERGHKVGRRGNQKDKKGKDFVEGKFFYKKKMDELGPEIIAEQEKMIDELFDEVFG
ncbi:hypothetical protein [Peptoniphilus sp.]|uniref:hypothetical protein n=1 Tax=Peptoniphilus sp. TaxID=1971214 RepID=UPI00399326DE